MAFSPVVDTKAKTVTLEGKTYGMRQLAEDSYAVMYEGVPLGRVVYVFGAANPVVESADITEEALSAIGEAWFAALDAQG